MRWMEYGDRSDAGSRGTAGEGEREEGIVRQEGVERLLP